MSSPLTISRPQDTGRRMVKDARWHPSCCHPDPETQKRLRLMNGVLIGVDTVSGEEILFRTSHVKSPFNVQRGPTLRPTGIKYVPSENKAQEREYFNALDEINELTVLLRNQEREA